MNKKWLFFILPLIVSSQISCDRNRVYEEYQGMQTKSWLIQDSVSFVFDDDIPKGPAILGIKYNQDYEFHNIYVRYILKDSLDSILENKLLDVPLFDNKTGKPLGKGFGSSFTKYDTLPLQSGNYSSIHFIQYMRIDELLGIEAVGLKRIME